jgi:hypothetical protein
VNQLVHCHLDAATAQGGRCRFAHPYGGRGET